MTKILNYGSLNLDFVYSVPHFVKPGETLASASRSVFAGGKGLNQSLAAAKAGAMVFHAGAIGSDGYLLLETLQHQGVDCHLVRRRKGASGHTVIQVDRTGQNSIILYQGTNFSQTREEIDATLAEFEAGDFLMLQNEINELPYLIEAGFHRGLKVCINASPLNGTIRECALNLCHLLFVNEIEGAALAGVPQDTDAGLLLEKLHGLYLHTVIVLTLGAKGSRIALPSGESYTIPAYKVQPVDTTGAGDTFSGYLVALISQHRSVKEAAATASAAAALAVTRKGAASSIPALSEAEDFMLKHGTQGPV